MAAAHIFYFISFFIAKGLAYTAESSSTYLNYVASRTVDGNTDQNVTSCSHTSDLSSITEAWIRVDLGRVYSLKSVKFWYRGDRRSPYMNTVRLRGYSFRVSNDTNVPLPKSSCYTDSGNVTLPTIIEKDCERTAQYIWIYQSNKPGSDPCPILEICEIKIFGRKCKERNVDVNCSKRCDHCKNKKVCEIKSDECDNQGCANNKYRQPLCKECIQSGMYGPKCENKCSESCKNTSCIATTGNCLYGCKPGYIGLNCSEECPNYKYGIDCSETCGHCLNNTTCQHTTGTCLEGCDDGYLKHDCKTPCQNGTFGHKCQFKCSGNCINEEVCYKTNGSCSACAVGFQGAKCFNICEAGMYGNDCSQKCGDCISSTACNHISGSCDLGCAPGWQNTPLCDEDCPNGKFGLNCAHNCSEHCLVGEHCNKKDGTCQGCSAGWETKFCNKTCDSGWYGTNCTHTCGFCTTKDDCHHTNGSCLGGCQEGFTGHNCSTSIPRIKVFLFGTLDLAAFLLIVCPLAGVLLIVIGIVTLVFMLRKREEKKEKQRNDIHLEIEDEEDEESPASLDDMIIYTTVQIRSKSIKTADLLSVIKSLEKDTDKGFTEEFNSIPYGEQSGIICTVGKLPENIPKNRFKTTFPYDHSRVVLHSSGNGNYINASFIKNTDSETVYIASQGPKPKTVGDFWQMIWQENVFVITMVTNLKEGDKIKCERYWPTSGDSKMVLEMFTVQLFSERIYANFSTHNLKLFNRETQETRQITHLQYTSWPDHGTPNPLELLSFYHYVSRAMEQHPEQKLVVHCSAGIGRTGTFIALDALHRQGVKRGKINIVEYVHTMREDRMNMIQNTNQYKFLYHALYESFRTGCHVLRKDNFVQEMEAQMKSDKATNLSNFRTEFKELDSMRRIFDESEKQTGLQNLKLNMTDNVLPADKMRIILSSHVPEQGTYYNAVPISTFTTKDCIIAGQYPVQGAGIDLIRLLVDQDCSSLVLTHPLSEIPHGGGWFSDPSFNYRVEVGAVTKMSADVNKCYVRIKPPSSKGWHKVSMYEIKTWNPTETLPQVLLDAVKRIQLCELVDPERKLTILSRDGASRCGEFCAVYNAIQQLQQDQEVDMFTIVRQLQSRRPEMISDLNEYLLCCQAVAEFIKSDSEDTYMNSVSNTVTVEENMYANT
nr:receptor-type tyrosine-protein phosphatase epsilon-like [Crassostrea gigas]